jgi:hypothetical protein
MTTDIAMRENNAPVLYTGNTFDRLASWARAAQGAHEMAVTLVQTSFVPEAFRGKAHEATAAILAGAEIGLDPMASLRSFDVIQGTAAPRANTLRAVVQANGHEIAVRESTATRAVVAGRRRGEQNWQTSTWTIERATKMGLTGKHNWKVQPQAMLVARATAECARLIASDAILGIPYASEELADDGAVAFDGALTEEVKPARRTAKRAPVQAEVVEPAPEPEFDDESEAPAVEMITGPQQKKLHALLNEHGLGNREDGLAAISTFLGREIASTKELTKQDAMVAIDRLESYGQEPSEPAFDDDGWPPVAQVAP